MIITVGYHSPVDFFDQVRWRGLPEPSRETAVLSSVSELPKARGAIHFIIFDTPFRLIRIVNGYRFDWKLMQTTPLGFAPRQPLWGAARALHLPSKLIPTIKSDINITQQIIEGQRANDVIDKVNRLKPFLSTEKMDRVISTYAKFLRHGGLTLSLGTDLRKIIGSSKDRKEAEKTISDIVVWSSTPAAKRLISAMKEVGSNWRASYEQIADTKGIRPFELSFFLVAYERSKS